MKTNDQKGLALPTSVPINPSIKGLGGGEGGTRSAPGIQPRENKAVRQKTVAEECLLPAPTDVVAALRRSRESQKHATLLHILFDHSLTRSICTAGTSTNRMGPASWARLASAMLARTIDNPLLQAVGRQYCLPPASRALGLPHLLWSRRSGGPAAPIRRPRIVNKAPSLERNRIRNTEEIARPLAALHFYHPSIYPPAAEISNRRDIGPFLSPLEFVYRARPLAPL